MYIIIHGKEHDRKKLQGKTISEFSKNLESEGWPSEFSSEEMKDRFKYLERKEGRALKRIDIPKLAKELKIKSKDEKIREIAREKKLTYFKKGYPNP